MSVASPKSRAELKEYILTKLGAPVLQINVSDAQLDVAINDTFQYYNERSHFLGTERQYITFLADQPFVDHFVSHKNDLVEQQQSPVVKGVGMVQEVSVITPGSNFPYTPVAGRTAGVGTTGASAVELEANPDGEVIDTDQGVDILIDVEGGSGTGCTVYIGESNTRTELNGLTDAGVRVYKTGRGYRVGDILTISNNNGTPATLRVDAVKGESPVFGVSDVRRQNNFITLPDDVVGVNEVMHATGFGGFGMGMAGVVPGAALGAMFMGGLLGDSCAGIGYDIVSYVAMREYLATLGFLFFPPIKFNFNMRTHRLFIDSDRFRQTGVSAGNWVMLDCMVKPSPDLFPDLFNDLWVKEMSVAMTQIAWGRNLTKYNQVSLPGGLTLNGQAILQQGMDDMKILRERFAMDWADPPLDVIG